MAELAAQARKRDDLDRRLRQSLPPPLDQQIRLADLRDGRAVLLAPSPAWAARVRMANAQILAALRALGVQADSVIVKIVPAPPLKPEPIASSLPLSRASAQHLRAAARTVADPDLRALFLEMASIAEADGAP
ncbi:MAG: DciA family protein [Rhodanobacteraceae bacterium]